MKAQVSFVHVMATILVIALVLTACAPAATLAPTVTPNPPTNIPTSAPTVTPIPPTATPNPAGRIDVGGYQLNYRCFGQGEPTVIVEAGLGDAPTVSLTWNGVVYEVRNTTRICIYDRAGIGGSDKAPTPRTSQDIARDLHTLLSHIPLPPPYILVAHSIGGFHVRLFAQLYPDEVAGIILVDTSHPDQWNQFAAAFPTAAPNESSLTTSGRLSWVDTAGINDNPEGFNWETSADQVRNAGTLGAIPLIVISANPELQKWGIFGVPAENDPILGQIWLALQKDQAALSSNSTLVIAETGDHYIQVAETKLVVNEIIKMVQEVQSR